MMTLPHFDEPNPSIEILWQEQARLKSQADKLIKDAGIMEIFSKYGVLSPVGGSYDYDLMVYPDLDIGLVSEAIDKQQFSKLVGELVVNQYVRKVGTADTVNFPAIHKGRPKGYWIGLELPFENDRWGVDCWVQKPDWISDAQDTHAERLKLLEQSGKDAILLIKYDLIRKGIYGKSVFSTDVYDAVLEKDVRSVEAFNQALNI